MIELESECAYYAALNNIHPLSMSSSCIGWSLELDFLRLKILFWHFNTEKPTKGKVKSQPQPLAIKLYVWALTQDKNKKWLDGWDGGSSQQRML